MANRVARQTGFEPLNIKPVLPDGLLPVSRPSGELGETAASVGNFLSDKLGRYADELAKVEGDRAGNVAGNDPGFRPTGGMTIRARAFDAAATTTYVDNLDASLKRDMTDLSFKHQNDPAGLAAAFDALKKDYTQRHVFPDIAGRFNKQFETLALGFQVKARDAAETRTHDQAAAALIGDVQQNSATTTALLEGGNPDDPARQKAVAALQEARRAKVKQSVERGDITAVAGAKIVAAGEREDFVRAEFNRLNGITNADDYEAAVAARKKELIDKGLLKDTDAFDRWDALTTQRAQQLRTQGKQQDGALRTGFEQAAQRVVDGFDVPESELTQLRAAAKTPQQQAIAALGEARMAVARQARGMDPAQLDMLASRLRYTARASGGASETAAEQIRFVENLAKTRRGEITSDPVTRGARDGEITVAPIDPRADAQSLAGAIAARLPAAKAYNDRVNGPGLAFTEDERNKMKAEIAKGGPDAMRVAEAIVRGGGANAQQLFRELGGNDSTFVLIGDLLVNGGPTRAQTARDIANGAMLGRMPDAKLPGVPKGAENLYDEEFGRALPIEHKARIEQGAKAIYQREAYGRNLAADSTEAEALYRSALQRAAGRVAAPSGPAQYGGVDGYSTGWFSRSHKVQTPPAVRSGAFRDVIQTVRDEDLEGATNADGSPVTAAQIKRASPVKVKGGYAFTLGDPASADPKFLGRPGEPYIMDFDKMEGRLRARIPGAFQ